MQDLNGWYNNFKTGLPDEYKHLVLTDNNKPPATCQEFIDSMKKVQEKLSGCLKDLNLHFRFFKRIAERLVENGILEDIKQFSPEHVEEALNNLMDNRDLFKNEFKQMCQDLNLPENTTTDELKDLFNDLQQKLKDFEDFQEQIIEMLVGEGYLEEGKEYELGEVKDAFSLLIDYEQQVIHRYQERFVKHLRYL